MKVAVTGASGFVGRYVLKELIDLGLNPIAITRSKANLEDFEDKVEIVELEINQTDTFHINQLKNPDVLIHLSWDGLPNYKSLHHFETELPKQYHFLKKLIETGLKNIFVAGTCFEYGMQSGELSASLETKPTNPYGFAKDSLRKQLLFLKYERTFNLTWGRLFYMYGEGQSMSSLYPQLKQAIINNEKVFNMSGGDQIRDYLHVAEAAKKIVAFALLRSDLGCINICSGNPRALKSIVNEWLSNNNWSINLNLGYYPYPDYEPMEFWGKSN